MKANVIIIIFIVFGKVLGQSGKEELQILKKDRLNLQNLYQAVHQKMESLL